MEAFFLAMCYEYGIMFLSFPIPEVSMNSFLSKFRYRLRTRRWLQAVLVIVILLFFLVGFWLIQTVTDPYDCRILDGVTIGGVDVGGMTRGQARKTLKAAAEETILSQPLSVFLPEEVWDLNPRDLKLNIRNAVSDAYSLGRKTNPENLHLGLKNYLTTPSEAIRSRLEAYALSYNTSLTQPRHWIEREAPDLTEEGFDPDAPCQVIMIAVGTPESHLDVEAALVQILDTYYHGLSAEPGTYRVELAMVMDQLPDAPDWEAIYAEYSQEAVNADVDLETFEVIPATYGQTFDLESHRDFVPTNWGNTTSIALQYQIPDILSDTVYYRDVLGHCETKHNDDENRNTNLRLVCEILDGYIVNPGEEFSYNGVVGERTKERGFKPATAYSGTRVIKDFGGGVCQGSSTLYNCVLLADLEVTERVCHGYTVNYLPIGLDAAVNWATKTDFKFRNNFHFPIQIKAKLEDGYMKMQILGVDEKDYYVEMRSGRSDEELRIYSNSYKYKYDKETGEQISKELEARSSYMYMSS